MRKKVSYVSPVTEVIVLKSKDIMTVSLPDHPLGDNGEE